MGGTRSEIRLQKGDRKNNKSHAPQSVLWREEETKGERRDTEGWNLEQLSQEADIWQRSPSLLTKDEKRMICVLLHFQDCFLVLTIELDHTPLSIPPKPCKER